MPGLVSKFARIHVNTIESCNRICNVPCKQAVFPLLFLLSVLQKLRSIVAMNENLKKQEQEFRAHCKVFQKSVNFA